MSPHARNVALSPVTCARVLTGIAVMGDETEYSMSGAILVVRDASGSVVTHAVVGDDGWWSARFVTSCCADDSSVDGMTVEYVGMMQDDDVVVVPMD